MEKEKKDKSFEWFNFNKGEMHPLSQEDNYEIILSDRKSGGTCCGESVIDWFKKWVEHGDDKFFVAARGEIPDNFISVYITIKKQPNPQNPHNTGNWIGVWCDSDGNPRFVMSGMGADVEKMKEITRDILKEAGKNDR